MPLGSPPLPADRTSGPLHAASRHTASTLFTASRPFEFLSAEFPIRSRPPESFAARSCSFSLVVVARGFFDLLADRLDATLDVAGLPGTIEDRAVLLLKQHAPAFSAMLGCASFQRRAQLHDLAIAHDDDRSPSQRMGANLAPHCNSRRSHDGGHLHCATHRRRAHRARRAFSLGARLFHTCLAKLAMSRHERHEQDRPDFARRSASLRGLTSCPTSATNLQWVYTD
jgi:hypothetical protein